MFEIDHIPIGHRDLNQLAGSFEALGFGVSDVCVYRSPEEPSAHWVCRAVFMRDNWLDLQAHPAASFAVGAVPHSCLFRAPSLGAARSQLGSFRTGPATRLTRRWETPEFPPRDLVWMSLRERIAPLVLALVEYPDSKVGHGPPAPSHPNTATGVLGLTFGGPVPGPAAEAAGRSLALSGFEYLPRELFERRFGNAISPMIALRFEVACLNDAAVSLRLRRVTHHAAGGAIFIPAQGALGCGVEFRQAAGG